MLQSESSVHDTTIDLIIFDCDGVLVDSEVLSQRVLLNMLSELGANISDDYFHQHFLGFNFDHVTLKVKEDFDLELTEEFRLSYRQSLIDVFATELTQTNGLQHMLSQLNVKTCVATSSSPEKVKHALQYTKLDHFFKGHVFTSSEVEHGKPAPDLFLHAANQMGVPPQNCLVIEDSQAGMKGALAANMKLIRFTGAGHLNHIAQSKLAYAGATVIQDWQQLFSLYPELSATHISEANNG